MDREPEANAERTMEPVSPLWSMAPAVSVRDIGEVATGWTVAVIPQRRMS